MYDPLFSQLEVAVLSALGLVVLRENEVRGEATGSVRPVWTCVVLKEEARGRPQHVRCARSGWWVVSLLEGKRARPLHRGRPCCWRCPVPGPGGCSPAPAELWLNPQMGGSLRPSERRLSRGGDWTPR